MFKQAASSSRQKIHGCFFQQIFWQSLIWLLSQHSETLLHRDFILKPIEKP